MPSSILRYGQDWEKDGKIDLNEWPDALASAANYLKGKGWQKGQPIVKGKANYRAIWRYNPTGHYVRIVGELAKAFGYLKKEKPGVLGFQRLHYNFTKFLVDREGNVIKRFSPLTYPSTIRKSIDAVA